MPFPPRIISNLPEQLKLALDRLPPKKRSIVIAAAVAAVTLLLLIIAGAASGGSGGIPEAAHESPPAQEQPFRAESVRRTPIPPEELFLPEEPDFIPGVLPGREQRDSWTAEDAEPFWQDQLRGGEQEWRDRVERTIDEILGSVP